MKINIDPIHVLLPFTLGLESKRYQVIQKHATNLTNTVLMYDEIIGVANDTLDLKDVNEWCYFFYCLGQQSTL